MNIVKLHIIGKIEYSDEIFDALNDYLNLLYLNRQIINKEYHFEPTTDGMVVNLFCPEVNSFEDKYSSIYALKLKKKIEDEFEYRLHFEFLCIDPEYGETHIPNNSKFIILYSSKWSPIISGESIEPIPLYKIPYTSYEQTSFDDINSWARDYERISGLWYNCNAGEKWANVQLQNFDSAINQQGYNICKNIEKISDIPTYYFLFNYRAWGRKKDKKRKCPICNGNWLIEDSTFNDFYAFKCDKCRIVSELSSNR